jgi:4-amino-4-deoxy-L-arabinose transferase-like glycosyltransferase
MERVINDRRGRVLRRGLSGRRVKRSLVAALVTLVCALAIRLDGITQPPFDFQPTRQYHAALLARAYYLEGEAAAPRWQKSVAKANKREEPPIEPPAMIWIAARAYSLAGGEHLWMPRTAAVLWWLAGALFLWPIARRLTSPAGALGSLAVYLFLPYGIIASRSFQPDPMMVALLLGAVFAVLRYHERPSGSRLLVASAVAALAVFAKPPMAAFFLCALFASLSISREGLRKTLASAHLGLFLVLSLMPAAGYYAYGTVVDDFLQGYASAKVVPHLLGEPFFWKDWFSMVTRVLGYAPTLRTVLGTAVLLLGLWGVLLARRGAPRAALVALWAGYVVLGLVFTINIRTHDYYSLPLVPIVALSLGPVSERLFSWVTAAPLAWRAATASIVVLVGLGVVWKAHEKFTSPEYRKQAALYERIGLDAGHTTRAVFLDHDYGLPVEYHGWLGGPPWPKLFDLDEERLRGLEQISPRDRFFGRYPNRAPGRHRPQPNTLIVTALPELRGQPALRRFLRESFSLSVRRRHFLIFRLRRQPHAGVMPVRRAASSLGYVRDPRR